MQSICVVVVVVCLCEREISILTYISASDTGSLVASSSIDLEDTSSTIGPVYPAPSEAKQAGLFGWLPGRNLVNRVVQKTKVGSKMFIALIGTAVEILLSRYSPWGLWNYTNLSNVSSH